MNSILESIKERIGIADEDDTFDTDVIDLINSAFADLNDIGVGPSEGYSIDGAAAEWDDFVDDVRVLSSVKDFVYLTVKLTFDPPTQTSLLTSMENRLKKLEWRLNVKCDST
ncbi:MAG: hypothetical protein J6Q60_05590 [Bacteroidaceae bacterium]|nr:hypothetical protein [Bacteroidaceae bacterium]